MVYKILYKGMYTINKNFFLLPERLTYALNTLMSALLCSTISFLTPLWISKSVVS